MLAIDPSLRSNGLCIDDGTTWLLKGDHLAGVQRLRFLRDAVEDVLEDYQPHVVMLEGYAYKGPKAHQVGEWGGVLRLLLHEMGRPVVVVAPAKVKGFATGKGNAKKPVVVAAMSAAAGRQFHKDGDEADAFALAGMAMAMVGKFWWPAAAERLGWISELPWPRVVREALVAA
ncbi:hypothetical protein ABS71_10655 [bacterium SCN 62-11]|nr:MAG: hypothetical protein ABS71_10655 [bacterium SCN 62-11]